MPAPTVEPTLLDKLREQRRTERNELADLIEARDAVRSAFESERSAFEARTDATDEERAAFATRASAFLSAEEAHAAEVDRRERSIDALTRRVKEQRIVDERRQAAALAAADAPAHVQDALTYRRDNVRQVSYFADLAATLCPQAQSHMVRYSQASSRERLERHAAEMRVELPKKEAERERRSRKAIDDALELQIRQRGYGEVFHRGEVRNPFTTEYRVTPNRTDGQGGYFIPPSWVDDFIRGLRPGRVTANLCRQMDMPAGTDVIVVPKLSTLTTVGIQGADNQPVSNTDWTDTAVTAQVKTLAGYSDIGIQVLDQSPYAVDEMILSDLLADYDKQYDLQILAGGGSASTSYTPSPGGSVVGLYSSAGASSWTGYNGITYTDASPAPWKFLTVAGAMASKIASNRFMLDDSFNIVAHPRRAWWYASGTDSNNRPLVESRDFGPFNVQAIEPDSVPAQGLVARLPWGPGIYASPNIPTNDTAGGGTSQDVAVGFLGSDAWAFEGQMHTDVFPELLSGTLAIRFRVYAYIAFLLRYGQSLAIASGSGFSAPQGAVSSILF